MEDTFGPSTRIPRKDAKLTLSRKGFFCTDSNLTLVNENDIARDIVDAAYQIHSNVGPGCLESAYEVLLAHELQKRGRRVELQVLVSIEYFNSHLFKKGVHRIVNGLEDN